MSEKKKTPQPGEAWLLEVDGVERGAIRTRTGWVRMDAHGGGERWLQDAGVRVLRRLVPDPEPWETMREARQIAYDLIGPMPITSELDRLAARLEGEHKANQEKATREALVENVAIALYEASGGPRGGASMTARDVIAAHRDIGPDLIDADSARARELGESRGVGACACGWRGTAPAETAKDWQREHAAHQLDALNSAGFVFVKSGDFLRDMASIADWQGRALRVIEAANAFLLDAVTGDGDPDKLAGALVDTDFADRFPDALTSAGYVLTTRDVDNQALQAADMAAIIAGRTTGADRVRRAIGAYLWAIGRGCVSWDDVAAHLEAGERGECGE